MEFQNAYDIYWPSVNIKTIRQIAQIFVAFSEELNFIVQINFACGTLSIYTMQNFPVRILILETPKPNWQ